MLSEEINLLNQGIEQLPDGYYNALAGQLASAYIRQAEATGNPGYQKDALRTYQQLENISYMISPKRWRCFRH